MASSQESTVYEFLAGLARLFQSGAFSDLTIRSKDRDYAVHTAVICPQSPFLWAACTQSFKESSSREIDLRKDDADAVHYMIRYFYTLAYPGEEEKGDTLSQASIAEQVTTTVLADSQETRAEIDVHESTSDAEDDRDLVLAHLHRDLLVYVLAEKYGVSDLNAKAAQCYADQLQRLEITMDIFDVVREVYTMTPSHDRGLRDIIVAKMHSELQNWVGKDHFLAALAGEGEFSADLLKYTVTEDLKQYEAALATIQHPGYCGTCRATFVVRRLVSRKNNVTIKKHCAQCQPWG